MILPVTLLRHGRHRPSRRRSRALHRRFHGTFRKDHTGQRRGNSSWLQAFRWKTKTYSPEYIRTQVVTAKNKGGIGFLFWNAANDYSKPLRSHARNDCGQGEVFPRDEVGTKVRTAERSAAPELPVGGIKP